MFVVLRDGIEVKHREMQSQVQDLEDVRKYRLDGAQKKIEQIERLLDVTASKDSLKIRVDKLDSFLAPPPITS